MTGASRRCSPHCTPSAIATCAVVVPTALSLREPAPILAFRPNRINLHGKYDHPKLHRKYDSPEPPWFLELPYSPLVALLGVIVFFRQNDTLPDAGRLASRDRAGVGEALLHVLVAARVFCAERVNLLKKYDYPNSARQCELRGQPRDRP